MVEPSTNDQIQSMLQEWMGKAKEKAGQVKGNPGLEAEGQSEQLDGTELTGNRPD